jgi:hypothetical protein
MQEGVGVFGTSHRDVISHTNTKNIKRAQVLTRVGAVASKLECYPISP